MTAAPRPARDPGWVLLYWVVTGAIGGYGVAGMMTIGAPILLAAGVLVALGLAVPRTCTRAGLLLVSGLGVIPLYLAWLNRGGPGLVCTDIPGGRNCIDAWNPWPFVAVGLAMIAAGIALYDVAGRRRW